MNPFNFDAATLAESDLARLPPHGGPAVAAFCGTGDAAIEWDDRGVCVLTARKGYGKSHLLQVRSRRHRSSAAASRTLFYPTGGYPRLLIDAMSPLHVVVPSWLRGRESAGAWVDVWQLAIVGLLAWITRGHLDGLKGFGAWFSPLDSTSVEGGGRADAADTAAPNAMLTWFLGRVIERLGSREFREGTDELKQALYYAGSDWTIQIKKGLEQLGKIRVAMYVDAPDELVALDQAVLWRNIQQGLLLAIWRFAKGSTWSRSLNIYATVRSDAFGSGHDHPDLAQALGLAMPLSYSDADLAGMVYDRIAQADAAGLARPLDSSETPLGALCGFESAIHEDRRAIGGGPLGEAILASVLRHSRRVPREVVAIVGAIYHSESERTPETVRRAVNAQASANISGAIAHSFLGWTKSVHGEFALRLCSEVLPNAQIRALAEEATPGHGVELIKFFVQHGLLGTAEPALERHRHYYVQRFAYDAIHGHEGSVSIDKDFFFVHPSLKEWIRAQNNRERNVFTRLREGVVGDLMPFESQPPMIRLGLHGGKPCIEIRGIGRLATGARSGISDPLKFLFVLLWACRQRRISCLAIAELRDVWIQLSQDPSIGRDLRVHLHRSDFDLAEKVRDWAKKINRDSYIRRLLAPARDTHGRKSILVSVSSKSSIGAQPEVSLNELVLDEVDWDTSLRSSF